MPSHPRILLTGLLLAGATLATAVGVTHYDGDSPAPPGKGPYVALGDSYTAGPKIPDQNGDPAGCDRSDRNYPSLVAAGLDIKGADFKDVSCSGATIADLTGKQSTEDGTNRSCGLSGSGSVQPRAPNGLGRAGPRRTRPRVATRIVCVVRAREASSLRDLAGWVRPEAAERP
ncbi:hypothetical protein [Streptomyces sp. NPDC005374]|uniref:hypothetical protein n=1 Tax=Streptomyces sp. NPDC005374 TaxID=3364713 RepID=UPI003690E326